MFLCDLTERDLAFVLATINLGSAEGMNTRASLKSIAVGLSWLPQLQACLTIETDLLLLSSVESI